MKPNPDGTYDYNSVSAGIWHKPIERVTHTDLVVSFDAAGNLVPGTVDKLFTNTTIEFAVLKFADGRADLTATPGHRFLTETGDYMEIGQMLRLGGGRVRLTDTDGRILEATGEVIAYSADTAHMFAEAQSKSVASSGNTLLQEDAQQGWQTYNFEVRGHHNYIADGIRVHNDSILSELQEGDQLLSLNDSLTEMAVLRDVDNDGDLDVVVYEGFRPMSNGVEGDTQVAVENIYLDNGETYTRGGVTRNLADHVREIMTQSYAELAARNVTNPEGGDPWNNGTISDDFEEVLFDDTAGLTGGEPATRPEVRALYSTNRFGDVDLSGITDTTSLIGSPALVAEISAQAASSEEAFAITAFILGVDVNSTAFTALAATLTALGIFDDVGTPTNTAPTLVADPTLELAAGDDSGTSVNLLANDTDPDGDTLSISGTPIATSGTVTNNGDGTLTYTPNAGFSGSDTITYTVSDGTNTVTGTLAVTVAGADGVVRGTGGADLIDASYIDTDGDRITEGDDVISAGAGNDEIFGLGGNDVIDAGDGNDSVNGGANNDTITAGTGDDTVISGTGSDSVDLGTGNDRFLDNANDASNSRDIVRGGAGWEIFWSAGGLNTFDGGADIDRVQYSLATAGVLADLADQSVNTGLAAGDTYINIENLMGSDYADDLRGDAGANTLWGRQGNDLLSGRAGDDLLFGGGGADTMNGGDGIDTVTYRDMSEGLRIDLHRPQTNTGAAAGDIIGADVEVIEGTEFNDTIRGDQTSNIIHGLGGDDYIDGHHGFDGLYGDEGNDTIRGGTGSDSIYGGTGDDIVYSDKGQDTTWLGAGNDIYHDDLQSDSNAPDTVYGGDGNDTFYAGTGSDLMDGGAGVDHVIYTLSNQLGTGVRVDLRDATGASNTGMAAGHRLVNIEQVAGSNFNDILHGDAGNNVLRGLDGDDALHGNDGNDLLIGGAGADAFFGGTGTDIVSYEAASEAIAIDMRDPSQNAGEALGDTFTNIEMIAGSAFDDMLHMGDDTVSWRLIGGDGDDTITGGEGDDRIEGGAGHDVLSGNLHGDDTIYGGDGNDRLYGGHDTDYLDGGAGDDFLGDWTGASRMIGGTGNDTFNGGDQHDVMTGGAGSDQFDFATNDSQQGDTITDFEVGVDKIRIFVASGWSDLTLSDGADGALVDYGDGNVITLTGVQVAQLSQDDFIFG